MGTIPTEGRLGARPPAVRKLVETRRGLDVAGRPDAILGEFLEFARGFLIQGGVRDLPADTGMREQAFTDGRGLRQAGFMPATARSRFEEY